MLHQILTSAIFDPLLTGILNQDQNVSLQDIFEYAGDRTTTAIAVALFFGIVTTMPSIDYFVVAVN